MDPKLFKRKKSSPSDTYPKFPGLISGSRCTGLFDGYSVSVYNKNAMCHIYNEGNFGKGSLSKSIPSFKESEGDIPQILFDQQWRNQLMWSSEVKTPEENIFCAESHEKISLDSIQLLLDSASSTQSGSWKQWKSETGNPSLLEGGITRRVSSRENIFENNTLGNLLTTENVGTINILDPVIVMVKDILKSGKVKIPKSKANEYDKVVLVVVNADSYDGVDDLELSKIKVEIKQKLRNTDECLKLNLVEAFFLSFSLGCLKILNKNGSELSVNSLWSEFRMADENFIVKYVIYHQYRSNGWTVKTGLKFGGDYLLYKIGPAYYHATYLIWILHKNKKMTWKKFVALNRLLETCNKELLLCEIIGPNIRKDDSVGVDALREFRTLQMTSRRWVPTLARDGKEK